MKKKRKLWYFSRGSLSKILLKMKLMTFLVLLGLVGSAADSYSQAAKFNLKMSNATVLEVFQQIEENSEFILLYNEKWVDVNRRVDVQVENESVKEVLDQTFKGTQNVYKIYDRQIVVLKDDKAEIPVDVQNQINEDRNLNSGVAQQQKTVAGVITDESGHPLPGVTVLEKGTANGTVTNTDGEYSLSISESTDTLQFSFIGMQTMIVPVDDRTVINIVMQQETEGLEEVVVIGYGTQRKGSVIGSVDRIETEQLKQPTRTISTSLAGRLAGVVSVQGSGEPGYDGADFWIRGVNTFTGNTSPLILVDGVEELMQSFA